MADRDQKPAKRAPILHPPLDAADFLSSKVVKVAYPEPLDLGAELGTLKIDPTKPGIFDDEEPTDA